MKEESITHFGIEYQGLILAAIFTLIFFLLTYFFEKNRRLQLIFSALPLFLPRKRLWKERFAKLPSYLLLLALALFMIALVNPHLLIKTQSSLEGEEARGLAIFLLLDSSTSMHFKVLARSENGGLEEIEKIDLSKRVAKQFITGDKKAHLAGREGDAIGLVSFARIARVLSPLTLDHAKVIEEINKIQFNRDIKQVGTAIGYAIYKTVSLIKATKYFAQDKEGANPPYEIKNPIIIIVTDGLNEINPDDVKDSLRSMDLWSAAVYAKANNVKIYFINIDPSFNSLENQQYNELYTLITRYTGGNFYIVNEKKDLLDIYRDIDQLEKSKIPVFFQVDKGEDTSLFDKISFYPYFLALGIVLIFLSVALEAFFFKRVP
jgi:Ca-activated chloride channel homolog